MSTPDSSVIDRFRSNCSRINYLYLIDILMVVVEIYFELSSIYPYKHNKGLLHPKAKCTRDVPL